LLSAAYINIVWLLGIAILKLGMKNCLEVEDTKKILPWLGFVVSGWRKALSLLPISVDRLAALGFSDFLIFVSFRMND